MPYITVRSYQLSLTFLILLATAIIAPIAIGLTYMWATRTMTYNVEEPLSVTSFPSSISTHPGENLTLEIIIQNDADVDYLVTLSFLLNDTQYQETYMTFSNITYSINPGPNNVTAWCATARKAPPAQLGLTIEFYRE